MEAANAPASVNALQSGLMTHNLAGTALGAPEIVYIVV